MSLLRRRFHAERVLGAATAVRAHKAGASGPSVHVPIGRLGQRQGRHEALLHRARGYGLARGSQ